VPRLDWCESSPVSPTATAPSLGLMTSLVLPAANTAMRKLFLREMSQAFANYFIVIQVGLFRLASVERTTGSGQHSPIEQPAHSPEVNPVEHVCEERRDNYVHNRVFSSPDPLPETGVN